MAAVQQLDVAAILPNLAHLTHHSSLCEFTPEALKDFRTATGQLMESLKGLDVEQLTGLLGYFVTGNRHPADKSPLRTDLETSSLVDAKSAEADKSTEMREDGVQGENVRNHPFPQYFYKISERLIEIGRERWVEKVMG